MSELPSKNRAEKPVLKYEAPEDRQPITIVWFVDEAEGADAVARLQAEKIHFTFVKAKSYFRRPDGSLARVQLRVRMPQLQRAYAALRLSPDELAEVEPALSLAGDAPVEFYDGQGKLIRRYVAFARYDRAQDLIDAAAVLRAEHCRWLLPLLVPRGSHNAAPDDGSPGRFVLRVDEQNLEGAREAMDRDQAPQDEDEPRCPHCRSWQVKKYAPPFNLILKFVRRREAMKYHCTNCDFVGLPERFFRVLPGAPQAEFATPVGDGEPEPFEGEFSDEEPNDDESPEDESKTAD